MLDREFKIVVLRSLSLILAHAPLNVAAARVNALARDVDRLLSLLTQ